MTKAITETIGVDLGDFNLDGRLDIAVAGKSGTYLLYQVVKIALRWQFICDINIPS